MGSFSLDSCQIQTVCLIYRQRLDCLHSSSPLLAPCGELSIMRYFYSRSSFSVLVFQSRISRFSFVVFSSSSSGFMFLIPHSPFDATALLSQSNYTFSLLLFFRPLAP